MRDEFKRRGDERKGRLTEEVGSEGEVVVVGGGGGATGCTYPKTPPPPSLSRSSLLLPSLSLDNLCKVADETHSHSRRPDCQNKLAFL